VTITAPIDKTSSSEAKIALFRSLFRGRDEVYPRRFESRKTGKTGYAPACANEWVRGICEKPRIKCADCPNRRFLAVSDQVMRWHLSGQDADGQPFVAGVYPLLVDETCFFLAIDFDKAGWQQDSLVWISPQRSSARGPVAAATSGFSSRKPSRRRWRAGSAPISSPRPWRVGRTSAWTHTTACFRTKTRCHRAASGT
jgi:hypothetical protein